MLQDNGHLRAGTSLRVAKAVGAVAGAVTPAADLTLDAHRLRLRQVQVLALQERERQVLRGLERTVPVEQCFEQEPLEPALVA